MTTTSESVLIVGAGPIGLATAISARRRGIDPLLIDAGPIASSIVRYPTGMSFFTTPDRLEIGRHPIVCGGPKPTREEALMYYRGVARVEELRIRTYQRFVGATRAADGFHSEIERTLSEPTRETIVSERLILATGYFDHPNRLNVPGEERPHVSHYSAEPHLLAGLDVVIVGGKNSAVELALNAFRAGARVTLVHRRPELKPSVKYWLRPDFLNRVKAGEIAARWETVVDAIGPRTVTLRDAAGRTSELPADRVFLLTGYRPDFDLLRSLGVELAPDTGRPTHDPTTLETNVPGLYLAGSLTAGRFISEVFIENGRYDGEKIFGTQSEREGAMRRFGEPERPVGE
ncbi:MAG: YpdA family putative bacillithiol disulfide reductase [Gemmatimonadales bacterium]